MSLTCNFCHHTTPIWYCRKDSIDVHRCGHCGLIYVGEMQQNEDLVKHYSDQYFAPYLATKSIHLKKRFKKRIEEIRQLYYPGTILDVGCGAGFFLQLAQETGYNTQGVELSGYAAGYARKKFGLSVFNGDIADAPFDKESFDIITLWHILEHVHDPRQFLGEVHRLLKPNGLMAVEVPNIGSPVARMAGVNWELMAPKEHFYYFNTSTVRQYLEMLKFKIVQVKTFYWTTPAMLLKASASQQNGLKKWLMQFMIHLASVLTFIRFRSAPSIFPGDVVTIYAQKKRGRR
jgi:2-polyprenyl-3-methyl-5-hydroxy-6-metoxy-1,4-benzoquinol methylase